MNDSVKVDRDSQLRVLSSILLGICFVIAIFFIYIAQDNNPVLLNLFGYTSINITFLFLGASSVFFKTQNKTLHSFGHLLVLLLFVQTIYSMIISVNEIFNENSSTRFGNPIEPDVSNNAILASRSLSIVLALIFILCFLLAVIITLQSCLRNAAFNKINFIGASMFTIGILIQIFHDVTSELEDLYSTSDTFDAKTTATYLIVSALLLLMSFTKGIRFNVLLSIVSFLYFVSFMSAYRYAEVSADSFKWLSAAVLFATFIYATESICRQVPDLNNWSLSYWTKKLASKN